MNVLVTGANGFVGQAVIPALLERGHAVTAAVGPLSGAVRDPADDWPGDVTVVEWDLAKPDSVRGIAGLAPDWVLHLAAISSGPEAQGDPVAAWEVNVLGTVKLLDALGRNGRQPRVLLISSGEVYGNIQERIPAPETTPTNPVSTYAATKLASEFAGLDASRRSGLPVIVARSFAHTGAGQDIRFVTPAFARRITYAGANGFPAVGVGNLDPVRDFLHVSDVVRAYVALLERGRPGEIYNVASGDGVSMLELFRRIALIAGARVIPEVDARLVRRVDVMYLVGDASKLKTECGWEPRKNLDEILQEVVDAQAN